MTRRLLALVGTAAALFIPAAAHATTTPITHIVVILEENHSESAITTSSMPYLTGLGAKYAHTTHLNAAGHPSLPNYLALTEGNTGSPKSLIGTDCGGTTSGCMQAGDNIYHQADTAGKSWAQWSESMPKPCDGTDASPYIVHHAPAPFYTDLVQTDCKTRDVALNKSAVPVVSAGFTFISPNRNDDAHSGSLTVADGWLKTVVGQLQKQSAWTTGSELIEVTFDEGTGSSNTVYTAFISPRITPRTVTLTASHYSTLRLNEELLGLPLLGGARTAPDLRSALGL